jgi:predicted glutamine amidotransferase
MCRLFGFKSSIPSEVHRSLLRAENALAAQSGEHPDGWGVVYYIDNFPHLIKNTKTAVEDHLFEKVSGIVSSKTVLAHIRNASVGDINILNCHPFQYGPWSFAHNGEIKPWNKVSEILINHVTPQFRRFILGNTDSEVCFYIFLSFLQQKTNIHKSDISPLAIIDALKETIKIIRDVTDDFEQPALLTFLLTNGSTMLGYHGGKELLYSTYKKACEEKHNCPHFSAECENPTNSTINHLLVSSEPISDEDIWQPLEIGEGFCLDGNMALHKFIINSETTL